MKAVAALSLCFLACTARALDTDDLLDRVDTALSVAAFQDQVRLRLSGTIDLEGYHFQQPAPGLIDSNIDNLFNPRLTLFLDAQIGSQVYAFVQSRLDRGFDPSDHGAQVRLDEYALRFTPWNDGRFTLQVGKFATVIGNWVPRHLSWENPFINAPLIYENITVISDTVAPTSAGYFDYREIVLGQDASFAWHHLQLWAEVYEARFEIPRVGNADTLAYYFEAKYKFAPQLFGALRWNQQIFGSIDDGRGRNLRWGQDLARIDAVIGYRFTSHTQLKLQYSFQHETTGPRDDNHLLAVQFTVRF